MNDRWASIRAGMILSVASLPALGASVKDAPKSNKPAEIVGYDYSHPEPQPATESLDLAMYARIREEGFTHSRIMEYAGGLFDDIGPRLTGSPNLAKANAWTRDQLTAM
jgi:carboxypeptidase Q